MKPEPFLAELNRLRKDLEGDPGDVEWLAIHHAFVFISYNLGAFQKYLNEAEQRGELDAYKAAQERDS